MPDWNRPYRTPTPDEQQWLEDMDRTHLARGVDRVDAVDIDAPRIQGRHRMMVRGGSLTNLNGLC